MFSGTNTRKKLNFMSIDFKKDELGFKNYLIFDDDSEIHKLQFTNKNYKNVN